jgi:soluble lytic murein transglycosylase-like protein
MKPGQMMIALVCGSALLPSMAQEERKFDRCFEQAANRYGLNKRMLVAIARTESALTPHVIGPRNQNGSYDIGMMQINSSWLPTLAKYGIGQRELLNACTNIDVGAWILAHNVARHGPTWKAVGAYNAASPDKQQKYVAKVQQNYILVGGPGR